jgi:hypothetical protein
LKFFKERKVARLDLLLNKSLETLLSNISINGAPIGSENDCILVQNYLSLEEKKKSNSFAMGRIDGKAWACRSSSLWMKCRSGSDCKVSQNIKRYLNWYENEYARLLLFVKQAGLNTMLFLRIRNGFRVNTY